MKNYPVQPRYSLLSALTLFAVLAATQLASATIDTWTGGGGVSNPYWTTAANWGGTAPVASDSIVFAGQPTQALSEDNFPSGTAFDGITFASGATSFALTGLGLESVLISGAAEGNNTGVINNSATNQTFTTLNLSLDWGYYTFGSPGGGPLQLNDTLSPAVNYGTGALGFYPYFGGVAYFVAPTSSSTFTLDPKGLITGLDGMGLMATLVNGTYYLASPPGNLRPLATVSGGHVTTYAGYTTKTGGGTILSNANANIELADTTTANYTADNIGVNTITVDHNPGNSSGTKTITVGTPPDHTLTLGGQGGIYVTDSVQGQAGDGSRQILKLTGPGNLTAVTGGSSAGMIVLGVNGTTSGNQLQVDDIIINNNNSFLNPVTLVKTGPGSALLSQANTYSGGTYVDQGFLEDSTGSGFGSGPIYGPVFVASNAEVYLEASGSTWSNSFSISPGYGPAYSYPDGAINIVNGTLAGPLNLLGSPVTSPPGNRIGVSGNFENANFTGRITGTGTLELMAEANNASFQFYNSSAQPNNWTGGLLIDEALNDNNYVSLGANNQLAGNNVTMVQSGTGVARLDLHGYSDTIDSLSAASSPNNRVVNSGGNSTLTMGAGDASGTFAGVVSDYGGVLSIVKIGAGTQTLSGANDYSGSTTVNAGTLVTTTASTGAGDYTVNNGATLDVQLAEPGETLQMNNLTLNSGCTLVVDNNGFGLNPSSAPINVGTVSGNGSVTIQLTGYLAPGTYPLVHAVGTTFSGTFNPPIVPPGFNASPVISVANAYWVTITGPGPTITQQPMSQTVCANDSGPASFTVNVSDLESSYFYGYQWYVSTDNGNTWQPDTDPADVGAYYDGGDMETLEVGDIASKTGYMYEVVVTDENGVTTSSAATLTVNPAPNIYSDTVTGGGSYCSGDPGVSVGLTSSDLGVNYQLVQLVPALGGGYVEFPVGAPVAGTGSQFNFPTLVTAGTYKVTAEPATGGCVITMNGPVTVTVNPAPNIYNVTGGGSYCAGGSGVNVSLSGSDPGVLYQLQPGGAEMVGNGSAISFGNQTVGGTYTVEALSGICLATMNGQVTVTVNPSPTIYTVTGGGSYCSGGSGVSVVLSGSDVGVSYQLVLNSAPPGPGVPGTGSAINFGSQTAAGTYTVLATSVAGCSAYMNNSAIVTVDTPPVAAASLCGTAEGHQVMVPVGNLLAHATGGALSITAVSPASAQGGTVTLAGGLVTYTPPAGYVGPDQFTYTLSDSCGTAQGTVSVTITAASPPPFDQVAIPLVSTCVNLDYSGDPTLVYVVQWESSLNGPWMDLSGTLTPDATGLISYSDCRSPLPSGGFYRIRLGP